MKPSSPATSALESTAWQAPMAVACKARALVIMVHLDEATRHECGQRFVADVLRSNGLLPVPLALRTIDEQARGFLPGQVELRRRLQSKVGALQAIPAMAGLPAALVAGGETVAPSVAAATRWAWPALRTLVLLDGQPERLTHYLLRLPLPTLMLSGRVDARGAGRLQRLRRLLGGLHEIEQLPVATRPAPAPGAHQALVHALLGWLARALPPVPTQRSVVERIAS